MNKTNHLFYSGASGLVLPMPKALYPPEFRDKSRLEYYSSLFNSLEVNSSFYKTPMAATVEKWAAAVPDHFKFTFKLSKAITHVKGLEFNEDDIEPFMQTIAHAGEKKGCLLIQFPPSLTIEKLDPLQSLLSTVNFFNDEGCKVAVEFRNRSWYENEVYEILREYHASPVLQDLPASATPAENDWSDFIYLRFHGPAGGYRGSYTDDFLISRANKIQEWMNKGKTVYCYFNNTMGDAVKNLQTLNRLVSQETIQERVK